MFHALCQSNADALVGSSPTGSDIELWLDTYRTLEHRVAKHRLASYTAVRQELAIRDFAQTLGSMQEQRIGADYDPTARFVRSQVMAFIDRAEDATRAFVGVPSQIHRSLTVHLLVRRRNQANQSKCHQARHMHFEGFIESKEQAYELPTSALHPRSDLPAHFLLTKDANLVRPVCEQGLCRRRSV